MLPPLNHTWDLKIHHELNKNLLFFWRESSQWSLPCTFITQVSSTHLGNRSKSHDVIRLRSCQTAPKFAPQWILTKSPRPSDRDISDSLRNLFSGHQRVWLWDYTSSSILVLLYNEIMLAEDMSIFCYLVCSILILCVHYLLTSAHYIELGL
jgi:hypothetical protein